MHGGISIIRLQIEARLRSLDAERAALEKALEVLSVLPVVSPLKPAAPRERPPRSRARRGENLEKILPVIAASPELAPREISQITGIDARVVSATLSKLRRQGRLPTTPE